MEKSVGTVASPMLLYFDITGIFFILCNTLISLKN